MDPGSPDDVQPDGQHLFSSQRNAAQIVEINESVPQNPLSSIPEDIGHHRALLFALDTPVHFDQDAWERYWPFVDNIWCLHNRGDVSAHLNNSCKTEKFWGGCRLARMWKTADRGERRGGRKRARRKPGLCPAKFRVVMNTDGVRTLERSKEPHSHDLDYIDSVKRCSGIRTLVADAFFAGWDSGPILAYLKDPANAPSHLPDLLCQAGGTYFERREIINILNIKLRAAYPGLDQHALKRQKEKYEGVKTCNVKGCNKSFKDAKKLAQHKKEAHMQQKHDHSSKMYTCPKKECHRHKRSKGFATVIALREHMLRMKHWGMAIYHGDIGGLRLVGAISERERAAVETGETIESGPRTATPPDASDLQSLQTFHSPDLSFLPSSPAGGSGHTSNLGISVGVMQLDSGAANDDLEQREKMLQRLHTLEAERIRVDQEMARLRHALFAG